MDADLGVLARTGGGRRETVSSPDGAMNRQDAVHQLDRAALFLGVVVDDGPLPLPVGNGRVRGGAEIDKERFIGLERSHRR